MKVEEELHASTRVWHTNQSVVSLSHCMVNVLCRTEGPPVRKWLFLGVEKHRELWLDTPPHHMCFCLPLFLMHSLIRHIVVPLLFSPIHFSSPFPHSHTDAQERMNTPVLATLFMHGCNWVFVCVLRIVLGVSIATCPCATGFCSLTHSQLSLCEPSDW